MADESELRELSERIARLSGRELDVEDRLRKEAQAEYLQQIETLRNLERQRAVADRTGAKREAG